MKKFIYIILSIIVITTHTSCELDTAPTGSVPTDKVFESTDMAKLAVNGVALLMVKQYYSQGFNGEGTIKMWYGEYPGNHFVKDLTGWAPIINSDYFTNTTSVYDYYPWFYYYRIIGDVNVILDNVDAAKGTDADKLAIKAQCLTYRAYSYLMLSQLYSKRWSDSNNGASTGLVLKTKSDPNDTEYETPLSTLAETYELIYDDLDTAIDYFTQSEYSRDDFFEIDINVAKAVYARAALTREDFVTAAKMAAEARAGYPLMNKADMTAGFHTANSEWIWGSYGGSDQNLYFYSYQTFIAYNSTASVLRSYPTMINKELYDEIPETDIRKGWWVNPAKLESILAENNGTPYTLEVDSITPGAINSVVTRALPKGATEAQAKAIANKIDSEIRSSYPDIEPTALTGFYMQFKVGCKDIPGVGDLCHFRSSEMILIEAEALVRQNSGKDSEAQALLIELNAKSERDPNYTTTKTGDELLKEIWKYRSIELWGEGFDWFDHKRTNRAIERTSRTKTYEVSSTQKRKGSFDPTLSITIKPNDPDYNDWTWAIPDREVDYNSAIKLP